MFPKISCVYMLTNRTNGKFYIGSTKNLYSRMKYHKYNAAHNPNKDLGRDIIRYGFDSFTVSILEECPPETLRQRERFFIESFQAEEIGYNKTKATNYHDLMRELNQKAWQNDEYRAAKGRASSALQKKRLKDPVYLSEKSAQLKAATDKMKKRVGMFTLDGEPIKEFDGVREAARYLVNEGIASSEHCSAIISDACLPHGRHKTVYKHVWKYL